MPDKNYFLIVEDNPDSLKVATADIEPRRLDSILRPGKGEELEQAVKKHRIIGAIVDYKLKIWVGSDNIRPIRIGTAEIIDGIDIAIKLNEWFPGIPVWLFSGAMQDLKSKMQVHALPSNIRIVPEEEMPKDNIYRFIPKFIEEVFEKNTVYHSIHLYIKPLCKKSIVPPGAIQTYYNKKILSSLKHTQDVWKVGEFAWMVSFNEEPDDITDEDLEGAEEFTAANPVEEFILKVDNDDFRLVEIEIKELAYSLKKSEVVNNIYNNTTKYKEVPEKYKLLSQFTRARFICDLYLAGRISAREAVKQLLPLEQSVQLESQKILFTEFHKRRVISNKEEIYEELSLFSEEGLPQVLDVFTGTVDSIHGKSAFVTLQSRSPEKIVMAEEFDLRILQDYRIETIDTRFEYTVYIPPIGGHAVHIEPF